MNLDDKICYCYGVTLRKLASFARRTRPQRPSQMTECLGAGTGCGWCIPFLIRIAQDPDCCGPDRIALDDLAPEQYAELRKSYIHQKRPRNTFDSPRPDDAT